MENNQITNIQNELLKEKDRKANTDKIQIEQISSIGSWKPLSSYSTLNDNKIGKYTFISRDSVLDACRNFIENNKHRYTKVGFYREDEVIKCEKYYLMNNAFVKRRELELNLAKPKSCVNSETLQTVQEDEGFRYEDLLRTEIEDYHSGSITSLARVILYYERRNKNDYLDEYCWKYDSLFYCHSSFTSELPYLIYPLTQPYTYSVLTFQPNQIYALVMKLSFSIDAILRIVQRAYKTMDYLETKQEQYQPNKVHFILLFDREFTEKQQKILNIFQDFFLSKTMTYQMLADKLLPFLEIKSKKITNKKKQKTLDPEKERKLNLINNTITMINNVQDRSKQFIAFREKMQEQEFLFSAVYYSCYKIEIENESRKEKEYEEIIKRIEEENKKRKRRWRKFKRS